NANLGTPRKGEALGIKKQNDHVQKNIMKTLAIIALFITANLGTALFANPLEKPTSSNADALKSHVAFHQRNVSALWQQYDLRVQQIRNSVGNHAELEREAKALDKTKRNYSELAKTLHMFLEVEGYVNESIERVDLLLADSDRTTIAAR